MKPQPRQAYDMMTFMMEIAPQLKVDDLMIYLAFEDKRGFHHARCSYTTPDDALYLGQFLNVTNEVMVTAFWILPVHVVQTMFRARSIDPFHSDDVHVRIAHWKAFDLRREPTPTDRP